MGPCGMHCTISRLLWEEGFLVNYGYANFLSFSNHAAFSATINDKVCYNGFSLVHGFVHPFPTVRGWEIEEERNQSDPTRSSPIRPAL